MRTSNYDKYPTVHMSDSGKEAWRGWDAIAARLRDAMSQACMETSAPVLAIECYTGV